MQRGPLLNLHSINRVIILISSVSELDTFPVYFKMLDLTVLSMSQQSSGKFTDASVYLKNYLELQDLRHSQLFWRCTFPKKSRANTYTPYSWSESVFQFATNLCISNT